MKNNMNHIKMKFILFLLCLSMTSCLLERWEETGVVNVELYEKSDVEMLNRQNKWDKFFIEDVLITVRIYPREFSPYSNSEEFVCSMYASSLSKGKSVFIDKIFFCGEPLNFAPKEMVADSTRMDFDISRFRTIEYFSHAEILFVKKIEDFPKRFSVAILAHTNSNEQKELTYDFKIALKKGNVKFLSDYM